MTSSRRERPGADPLAHDADVRQSLLDWLSGLDQLGDEESSQRALRDLIRRLDLTDSTDRDPTSARVQALTRTIAAAGRVLIRDQAFPDGHPVPKTLAAAEHYSRRPSEQAFRAYFDAATRSYPYGAGEGCYKVRGSTSCEPGSGCRSGAGSLDQVAAVVGAPAVTAAIEHELGGWLGGG
jgi:hypothetical protein